jgi:dihydrolipoamide dehydrogenase
MVKEVKVAIIGAGSAGLSALRQVKKHTNSFVLIDQTPLGTTCARTGCMPSKALIHVAKAYHQCKALSKSGIQNTNTLEVNLPAVLQHVRTLRDHFTENMAATTKQLAGEHLIEGKAEFVSHNHIRISEMDILSEKIIIATGARPRLTDNWQQLGNRVLTTDTLFEQDTLPERIAVIGLGPIGLEIGQALHRLGLEVTGFDAKPSITITTDPDINTVSVGIFKDEFPIFLDTKVELELNDAQLTIKHQRHNTNVDAALIATGVEPNLDGLGLEKLNTEMNDKGVPVFNRQTMQIGDYPIFIAGDVNGCRPILHEALDEGFIAGRNSIAEKIDCFCRRTPLYITFSDPQIAVVGKNYRQLHDSKQPFVTGKAGFQEQSRAILEQRNQGLMHIYAHADSGKLLGAELVCPGAEHLAHQLAVEIKHESTVSDLLENPYYHPTLEEALRSALQDAGRQLSHATVRKVSLCDCGPEVPLC